eukprot:scaffold2488_cov59-Isochrysis_galbana.AAC.1
MSSVLFRARPPCSLCAEPPSPISGLRACCRLASAAATRVSSCAVVNSGSPLRTDRRARLSLARARADM